MTVLGRKKKKYEATDVASPRKVEGWAIVLTWRYADGSWNTETITDRLDKTMHLYIQFMANFCKISNIVSLL